MKDLSFQKLTRQCEIDVWELNIISYQHTSQYICQCTHPAQVLFDQGTKFKSEFIELWASYGIKPAPTIVKNPIANAVVERVQLIMHGGYVEDKNLYNWKTVGSAAWQYWSNDTISWIGSPFHSKYNDSLTIRTIIDFGQDIWSYPYV